LRQLSGQRKTLAGLDQRLEDTKQLSAVYRSWSALVGNRRRAVLHLTLRSFAAILFILLATALLSQAIRHAFRQTDGHRLHQLRVIARTPQRNAVKARLFQAVVDLLQKPAVIPVAQESGVRLALHPNDPPAPISRGSGQIMGTVAGWKK
jgi:hypothetical protein